MSRFHLSVPDPSVNGGGSPFDKIRRIDTYGREYWTGRDLQPLMEYSRWEDFAAVIKKARDSLALVQGADQADHHFREMPEVISGGRWGQQTVGSYQFTRFGAYLAAMAGDDTKDAVAHARVYFAVRAREAELGALEINEVRQTALARAREMVDYKTFRDMMADNATDYEPSSKATALHFAKMQNKLYLYLTGMTAVEIRASRPLSTWPGCEEGKPEPSAKNACRKVAKNYLTSTELAKLDRLVGRLCLRADDIADDNLHLSLAQWDRIVDMELATTRGQLAA